MPGESSQRALRRIVADLAALADDDIDAILGEIDPEGRALLSDWLRAYRTGGGDVAQAVAAPSPVSDWLERRLSDAGAAALTPRTRETLRRLGSERAPTREASAAAPRRPGLDLLGRWR